MDITEELKEAIKTTQARHAVYGNESPGLESYERSAAIVLAMFPNGVHLTSAVQVSTFSFLFMIVSKLGRFAQSLDSNAPHQDSMHDIGIYAFMLERYVKDQRKDDANLAPPAEFASRDRDFIIGSLDNIPSPSWQCISIFGVSRCQLGKGHDGLHSCKTLKW